VITGDGACVCREEWRWGRDIADLFASNANNECGRTYSLHGAVGRRVSMIQCLRVLLGV
jgi:hypothetical protein